MRVEVNENSFIEADSILIGDNVKWGKDINIKVRGTFKIGSHSYVGDRFSAIAENITIGDYFFNVPTDSRGMFIGGGSSGFPYANLIIGDRCTCHTGHINLARSVTIGDDVGLSHDVDIITHGSPFSSFLEGYPVMFAGVNIGNSVIIGWKTTILGGTEINNNIVVGSNSTVTKSLLQERAVYAGSPAKLIKKINTPSLPEKKNLLNNMILQFNELMSFYDVPNYTINTDCYPNLVINNLTINVETFHYSGEHDIITDAFRDFARRYGIRVFSPRGFRFKLERKSK